MIGYHEPYNRITDWKFVDANTGKIVEEFKMREFFEWKRDRGRNGGYEMVRHYQLAWEAEIIAAEKRGS